MTERTVSEPTLDDYGSTVHPAFGMISASRVTFGQGMSKGPYGAILFDSDVRHHETIRIKIYHASRRREGSHDYIHPGQEFTEVEMSLAQWASFVSSMNTTGVPCTIRRTETEVFVDALPYDPRLAQTMSETKEAAAEAFNKIKEAFAAVKEKPTKANIRDLEIALQNATPNVDYATRTLAKHAEDVVQKARADIEAMAVTHARQLGLTAGERPVIDLPALTQEGDES